MATETKCKKKKSSKRTYPRKKAHRKIVELTLNEGTKEMLLDHLIQLDRSRIRAEDDMQDFILNRVVEGVIEPANEKLDPAMQQTSLTIYSADGKYRFAVNQQINRGFDGRAQQATGLITDFINDHKLTKQDTEVAFLMKMLESMLFGASRKKQFRWTPELKDFMAMKDEELPDERLLQARDILNEAYYTHRSQWYYSIHVWSDKQKKYIKHEEALRVTSN